MRLTGCLRIQAHAKINWCLAVTGKTDNGYHLLDMLMQRISLYDTLYASPSDELSLTVVGQPVQGSAEDNLVFRAAQALRFYAPNAGAKLTLVKRIPQGAGMGGGSSDAAAALKLLNRLWKLDLDIDTLAGIALRLGADVRFFLNGAPIRVQGIGEILTPVTIPAGIPLVLVEATEGLNTGRVYSLSDREPSSPPDVSSLLARLSGGDVSGAARFGGNMLYHASVKLEPKLDTIKRALEASGALYVQMTGSGAVVYGAYESDAKARLAAGELTSAFPGAFVASASTIS